MKVLQVSKFYPPVHGGIETVARDLSDGFRRHGVEVDVLCANEYPSHADARDASGVRVTRTARWATWLSTSVSPRLVHELAARRSRYDVVHVHMPDPLAALAVWIARPRARVVLHWHSDVVRQASARRLYAPLENWLLERADAVVATSPPYAESSPQLRQVADKVHVIPIGVPAPRPVDEVWIERAREAHPGRRIVFALGRMTYYKGWEVLVDAARALPENVVVVVGGGGPELPRYRALAEAAGVAERVRFVGPLTATRVEAYFATAELFCLASTVRAEAYGVVAAEAMARGLAVVATDIPGSGIGWLVEHEVSGLKVPVRDAAALAAAIRRLLDDDALRRRCGEAGRARWAQDLSVGTMGDRVVALYRELLDGASSR